MQNQCEGHWVPAKRVLRYLKGTRDFGLKYSKVGDFKLIRHLDLDFDGDEENGISTSSYLMSLGSITITSRSQK